MRAQRAEGLQDRASLYAGQAPGGPSHCSPFLTVLRPKSSLPPALKHRTPFLLRGKAMTCARPKSAHVISCMAHRLQTPFPHPPSLAGSLQPLPSTDFKGRTLSPEQLTCSLSSSTQSDFSRQRPWLHMMRLQGAVPASLKQDTESKCLVFWASL